MHIMMSEETTSMLMSMPNTVNDELPGNENIDTNFARCTKRCDYNINIRVVQGSFQMFNGFAFWFWEWVF